MKKNDNPTDLFAIAMFLKGYSFICDPNIHVLCLLNEQNLLKMDPPKISLLIESLFFRKDWTSQRNKLRTYALHKKK